ncbi:MAG: 4-hydroxy-tetrahydrodipicolinate reductase [Candidatus Kapaibacterium sp.]
MSDKLKIALLGYGAMGREVEKLAGEANIEICEKFDIDNPLSERGDYEFEAAIDFSWPEAVPENVRKVAALGKNIVVGATGWYAHMEELRSIIEKSGTGLVWASNFSIGMRMFFRLTRLAAKMADRAEEYDVWLHEMHHSRKKDAPSGTAVSLGKIMLEEIRRKEYLSTECGPAEPGALGISSGRGGNVPGTHTIYMDSPEDTIELTHRARSRAGFARGAIRAAQWIHGRRGFHEFDEVIDTIFGENK